MIAYFQWTWLTVNILAGAAFVVTGLGPRLSGSLAGVGGQLESQDSNLLSGETPLEADSVLPPMLKAPSVTNSVLPPELEALRNFQEEFQLEDSELEKVVETILTQENSIETFEMD